MQLGLERVRARERRADDVHAGLCAQRAGLLLRPAACGLLREPPEERDEYPRRENNQQPADAAAAAAPGRSAWAAGGGRGGVPTIGGARANLASPRGPGPARPPFA